MFRRGGIVEEKGNVMESNSGDAYLPMREVLKKKCAIFKKGIINTTTMGPVAGRRLGGE